MSAPFLDGPPIAPSAVSAIRVVDGQDDVSNLLLRVHVAVRLDHVLQRVGPVDDGAVRACLDELLQEEQVLAPVPSETEPDSARAGDLRDEAQCEDPAERSR